MTEIKYCKTSKEITKLLIYIFEMIRNENIFIEALIPKKYLNVLVSDSDKFNNVLRYQEYRTQT